jgi:hypothetical protein
MVLALALLTLSGTYCSTVSVFTLYTIITAAAEAMAAVTADHGIVLAPLCSCSSLQTAVLSLYLLYIQLLQPQLKLWQLLQLIT